MEIIAKRNRKYEISGHDPQVAKLSVTGYSKFIGLILSCFGFAITLQDENGKTFYLNRKSAIKALNTLGWNLNAKTKAENIILLFQKTYPAIQLKPLLQDPPLAPSAGPQPGPNPGPAPAIKKPDITEVELTPSTASLSQPNLKQGVAQTIEQPAPIAEVELTPSMATLPQPNLKQGAAQTIEQPASVLVVDVQPTLAPQIKKFVFVLDHLEDSKILNVILPLLQSAGEEFEFLNAEEALEKKDKLIENIARGEIIVRIFFVTGRADIDLAKRHARSFNEKFNKTLNLFFGTESVYNLSKLTESWTFINKQQILTYKCEFWLEMRRQKIVDPELEPCLAELRAKGLLLLK